MALCDTVGHLGVKKMYGRVLRLFYWPLLKKDIALFIKTCHTCQLTGKPNQTLKQAQVCLTPLVDQLFEQFLIDCVNPLGYLFRSWGINILLTVMSPVAYVMRKITTRFVVKALSQFISIFGMIVIYLNYEISTLDRKKSTQVCHVNLLKPYFLARLLQSESQFYCFSLFLSVVLLCGL